MFGFLKRRDPEPPEPVEPKGAQPEPPTKGVTLGHPPRNGRPSVEETITEVARGVHFHSFRYAEPSEAQRQAAEDAAVAEYDRSLNVAGQRAPITTRRRSIFDTAPDPQRFPH